MTRSVLFALSVRPFLLPFSRLHSVSTHCVCEGQRQRVPPSTAFRPSVGPSSSASVRPPSAARRPRRSPSEGAREEVLMDRARRHRRRR